MFLNLLPSIIFDSSADVLHPFLVYEASIVLNQTSCGDLLSATLQTTTGDPWEVSQYFYYHYWKGCCHEECLQYKYDRSVITGTMKCAEEHYHSHNRGRLIFTIVKFLMSGCKSVNPSKNKRLYVTPNAYKLCREIILQCYFNILCSLRSSIWEVKLSF